MRKPICNKLRSAHIFKEKANNKRNAANLKEPSVVMKTLSVHILKIFCRRKFDFEESTPPDQAVCYVSRDASPGWQHGRLHHLGQGPQDLRQVGQHQTVQGHFHFQLLVEDGNGQS